MGCTRASAAVYTFCSMEPAGAATAARQHRAAVGDRRQLAQKTPAAASAPAKRKRRRRRQNNYDRYIYRVLKQARFVRFRAHTLFRTHVLSPRVPCPPKNLQVHPDCGISRNAMAIINDFVNHLFERLATEAGRICAKSRKATLSERDFMFATMLVLRGELAKHAVTDATCTLTREQGPTRVTFRKSSGGKAPRQSVE